MIKFKPEDMWVEYHYVSQISPYPAITTIDQETGQERKFRISKQLYNAYKRAYKVTWFMRDKPHRMAFLMYKGQVIEIEPAPLFLKMSDDQMEAQYGINIRETREAWVSLLEKHYSMLVERRFLENLRYDYYFDGQFIFRVRKNMESFFPVSKDGHFYMVKLQAYKVSNLKKENFFVGKEGNEKPMLTRRLVQAYHTDKVTVVSPSLPTDSVFKEADLSFKEDVDLSDMLDRMNERYQVNLDFVLVAAKAIREFYGYHAVGFLRLHDILTHLKVSTLKGVEKSVRRLTPVPVDVKSAIAWLMGFMSQEQDYERLQTLFKVYNYLLTKGIMYTAPEKEDEDALPELRFNGDEDVVIKKDRSELPLVNPEDYILEKQIEGVSWANRWLTEDNTAWRP